MHIPQPMPDELDWSLLGRIRILNALGTEKETLTSLRSFLVRDVSLDHSHVVLLALATGRTVGQFVTRHTLAPFHFGFADKDEQLSHADRAGSYLRNWYGRRRPITVANLCPKCVGEDRSFWGYSYWRRAHHLPGVTWCVKHGCGLLVASHLHPYTNTPATYVDSATPIESGASLEIRKNPIAVNYAKICLDLLDKKEPIIVAEVQNMLDTKVREFGLHGGKRGGPERPMLSDVANAILPREWLVKHFSPGYTKGQRSYVGSLNRTIGHQGTCHAQHYALAVALASVPESQAVARKLGIDAARANQQIAPMSVSHNIAPEGALN